jgi:nitroimidazol reductase NimA-like FMN-containing flavoprotein (pyridoxamine 5'-phosphate oxidase superfamily)
MSQPLQPTPRTTLGRHPERGSHDRATVHRILDEALVCHVGFLDGGVPYVMPASFGRDGDRILLHGSARGRMMCALASGGPACVTVTLLDGLVLARSAFHHSVNYRSVVVLGTPVAIDDRGGKREALRVILEHTVPGRWADARPPTDGELDATAVVALPIDEASAKIRRGPPVELERDAGLPAWAGVLPLATVAGAPEPDAAARAAPVPEYLDAYTRRR